ncbi:MAG: DUF3108 domain-containing protein, partial [Magnetococcales bacterium]|nr:DUF3108 domain-containing protein [Magnetococcales bacterium]
MKKTIAMLLISLFWFGSVLPMAYGQETLPPLGAAPGERLTFNIHWMGIPAGKAFMESRPASSDQYLLMAGVESIGAVKFLYPIKDLLQAEGNVSAKGLTARYYMKQQQRGDQSKLIEYRFDR